ncbi:transposase [Roseateles koreensis]|uniref:Transposase n=1 Tax=Roseateles koreensis TaxID=2987526 RepID=A0ABT5KNP9_9BURK|nr:transposase [Roseateles koreensis]MDC8784547.1 transposase [Roseateles koreensis]
MEQGTGGRWRRVHSDEFKAHVVEASKQPGVSMAAVAMANGINANLLRRWVLMSLASTAVPPRAELASLPTHADFLPVPMPTVPSEQALEPAPAPIRIDVQRGSTAITVLWPVSAAAACASCLRELLS